MISLMSEENIASMSSSSSASYSHDAKYTRLASDIWSDDEHQRQDKRVKECLIDKKGKPVVWPTRREIDATKRAYQYKAGLLHFAIAGVAGTGKSSLINAFRGISNNDPRAAGTGIVETTMKVTRYPDPNSQNPFVWYDVPGAGTMDIPDWQYFNNQGLYIFDCIIVLFDNRFTATDVAILKNCQRFNIPSYIVRSKSNQHIQNIMKDLGGDSDDEDDETCSELFPQARDTYIKETRKNVKANLEKAELPPQRVYTVSKGPMLKIIRGGDPKKFIDEYELLEDILIEAKGRRLRDVRSNRLLLNSLGYDVFHSNLLLGL